MATANPASREQPSRPSSRAWLIGALLALALHGGAVVFGMYEFADDSDVDFGAPALAIDVDLAAPPRPPVNLPAGPDSEESAAAPPVIEQKDVLKESELPKDTPTETENPDRVVSPDTARKPVEDDPNVKPDMAMPSTEAVASQATAIPSSENIPDGQRSTTPAQGIGESTRVIRATWQKELAAHLNRNLVYPEGREGRFDVGVTFDLDRRGHVVNAGIVKSSGDPVFDAASLALLKRADPMPPPPAGLTDDTLHFNLVWVNFGIKKSRRR
jgi:TonB family protein